MKKDSSYAELAALNHDIRRQQNASIAFALFNKQKINDFHQRNAIRLNLLNKKINDLVAEFVEHDTEGSPVIDTEKPGLYKYKSEEDKAEFDKQWEEFAATTITINI